MASTAPRAGSTRSPTGQPAAGAAVGDLSKLDERELVALHRHPNEWFVRQARRVLADRAARGEPLERARKALAALFDEDPTRCASSERSGRSMSSAAADDAFLRALLDHEHEAVRAWAIRLLTDDLPLDTIFSRRGRTGRGPACRPAREARGHGPRGSLGPGAAGAGLDAPAAAGASPASTWPGRCSSHAEDAADHNLPALIWTGLIPVADADPAALGGRWRPIAGCRTWSG